MPSLTVEQKIELLMRKTNKLGDIIRPELGHCWEWTGSKRNGYGEYSNTSAHRKSYELHKGKIPDGLFVLHSCDNRACINPDHLRLGTNQDNINDKVERGRARGYAKRGENSSYAKLTNSNIIEIRENPHNKCLNCLSAQFKVCPQQISRIQHNERWSELVEKEIYEDAFWKRAINQKIIRNQLLGECWETIRNRMQFFYKNKHINGHRIAYMIKYGDIPHGKIVRHKCDNSKCINPEHLEIGSHQDNMRDKDERGRTVKGEIHHASKLTNTQAIEIFNNKGVKSLSQLATDYGISKQSVSSIWKKESWKHVHNTS